MSQNEKFKANAEKYTRYVGIYKGNYLLNNEIRANKKEIDLVYGGSSLTEEDKKTITHQAGMFSLDDAKVTIKQGISIEKERQKNQSEEERLRKYIPRIKL
jgi:pyruvate dehydrogenase complex dehydrogenase (E1) component